MKRWDIVAMVDGAPVKMVVRGVDKTAAEFGAHKNYKGITKIISIEERSNTKSFPTSASALKRESYTFTMRPQPSRTRGRKTNHG